MLVRWMLPFPYIRRPTLLLVRNIVYEDPDKLFSLFKHESLGPDVKALNASIFVHVTPNSINGKEYCAWGSQMSVFSWFKHGLIRPDVRALNATAFVHSTPINIIGMDHYVWRLQTSHLAELSKSP